MNPEGSSEAERAGVRKKMSHTETPQLNSPARGVNSTGQAENTEKMTFFVLRREKSEMFYSAISVGSSEAGVRKHLCLTQRHRVHREE